MRAKHRLLFIQRAEFLDRAQGILVDAASEVSPQDREEQISPPAYGNSR
jgi:hypothetical protein